MTKTNESVPLNSPGLSGVTTRSRAAGLLQNDSAGVGPSNNRDRVISPIDSLTAPLESCTASASTSALDAAIALSPQPKRQKVNQIGRPPVLPNQLDAATIGQLVSTLPLLSEWVLPSGKQLFVEAGQVGRGSFGHVLVAVDDKGQLYAIKQSVTSGQMSPSKRRVTRPFAQIKFEHEMTQKFCAPQSEIFRSGNDISWTMPLQAGSLQDVMRALGPAQAQQLVLATLTELLGLLTGLHSKGYAHGDIKPDNLLVGFDAILRLGDMGCTGAFGASKDAEPGDFNRLAPEHATLVGQTRVSAAADMWAAGIVVWEMAVGKENPFRGKQSSYIAWHRRQHVEPDGRICISGIQADGEWGTMVRTMVDGNPQQAALPGLADVLVNDMLHPDATRRADASALQARLPSEWAEVALSMQQRRAQVIDELPTATRGRVLRTWIEHRNDPAIQDIDPEAGYRTP